MFTSITEIEIAEQVPKSSLPWVWVGFLFAGAFFVIQVLFLIRGWDLQAITAILILISLSGTIYWLFCVHRIHKVLRELTHSRYPVSPNEAAFKHFIPFYNLFWIFSWPTELSTYLNRQGRVSMISGNVIGAMLLLALLITRFIDGAVGMTFEFAVTMYMAAKVKSHVKLLRGVTPDQLPPLPDPRIFSRPIESVSAPVPEVVKEPSAV